MRVIANLTFSPGREAVIAAVAITLSACVPIPYTKTYPLSLAVPPASPVQGSLFAPSGAPTISVSGSVDSELAKVSPGDADLRLEGALGGAFLFIEIKKFKSDRDLGAWARDGLANKLEAAGYRVQRVDAAAGPILVTIDVTGLSAKSTASHGPPGIHVYFGANPPIEPATCSVELSATIKVLKNGEPVFSNSYLNSDQKVGAMCGEYHGMYLEETITKAFEKLLAQAVPELTPSLGSTTGPH